MKLTAFLRLLPLNAFVLYFRVPYAPSCCAVGSVICYKFSVFFVIFEIMALE